MSQPKDAIELLRDLVALGSVNPKGDPGTDAVGEAAVASYVGDFLRSLGAEVELTEVEPGRPNVTGTFRPEGPPEAHLAIAPHTDTVSVVGMTVPPFTPDIRDGRLYGRGSSDTKGPMAAALWALAEWARSPARSRSRIQWTFCALMGEEEGSTGAAHLCRSGFKADFAIILEPTSLEIVHAHKGSVWASLRTAGRAAHAATPDRGSNAIYGMVPALQAVRDRVLPHLAEQVHPLLGAVTLSVGTIEGGSQINIVPDWCQATLDIRTHPNFDNEAVAALLQQELKRAAPEVEFTLLRSLPPLLTPRESPWVKQMLPLARGLATANWFCDASIFAQHGIPSVAMGPGSIAQAHTKDEFIAVDDYLAGVAAFSGILEHDWRRPR